MDSEQLYQTIKNKLETAIVASTYLDNPSEKLNILRLEIGALKILLESHYGSSRQQLNG